MHSAMVLAPFYRRFELPWEADAEEQRRFRRILRACVIALVLLGLLFPLLPTPQRKAADDAVPQRLARVMIAQKPKPPPPPPPKAEEKPKVEPEKRVAAVRPPVDRTEQARQRARQQMRQLEDEFADLRQVIEEPVVPTRNLTGAVAAETRLDRSLITSRVGSGSGGIVTSNSSRGFGTGAGSLTGLNASNVSSNIARGAERGATRTGVSGKAGRSREEIELIFDRNKGAIHALYSRALRERPELQGKMVLEFTIAPSGEVTMCRIVSSELRDPELERKIVARVRLFRFDPRDVETITTTKPIDFFPA
jgi:periplasmic protein TonB